MRCVPYSKCLSRQQELAGMKPEKEVQLDATKGSLIVMEGPNKFIGLGPISRLCHGVRWHLNLWGWHCMPW